jgi:hypothetical protein
MAWRNKRIEAMRRNLRHVSVEQLEAALFGLGFTWRSGKGDHRVYVHAKLAFPWSSTYTIRT